MWYAFRAWNSATWYGWTRDPLVAEAVADKLNAGQEVNLHGTEELGEGDDTTDDQGNVLARCDCLLCDDDTTLEQASGGAHA